MSGYPGCDEIVGSDSGPVRWIRISTWWREEIDGGDFPVEEEGKERSRFPRGIQSDSGDRLCCCLEPTYGQSESICNTNTTSSETKTSSVVLRRKKLRRKRERKK